MSAAHTPTPLRCTFDPASGDDCGYISIWRNDDTPTASLVSRLADTPLNREVAAFIVKAANAHEGLVKELGEAVVFLELAKPHCPENPVHLKGNDGKTIVETQGLRTTIQKLLVRLDAALKLARGE